MAGEKKQTADNEKGGKQGRVAKHIKWTAWLARQIMQVEFKYKNKDSSRRDCAAEQLFTCNAASLSSAPERGLVQGFSVSLGEPSTKRSGELVPVLAGSGLQSGSEPFCLAPQPDAKKLCSAIGIPTVQLGALDKILFIGVPVSLPWLPGEGFRHHHRSRRHVTKLKTTQSHGRNGEKRIELTSVCGPTNKRRKGRRNELAVDWILSTAPKCHTGKWWPNPVR